MTAPQTPLNQACGARGKSADHSDAHQSRRRTLRLSRFHRRRPARPSSLRLPRTDGVTSPGISCIPLPTWGVSLARRPLAVDALQCGCGPTPRARFGMRRSRGSRAENLVRVAGPAEPKRACRPACLACRFGLGGQVGPAVACAAFASSRHGVPPNQPQPRYRNALTLPKREGQRPETLATDMRGGRVASAKS